MSSSSNATVVKMVFYNAFATSERSYPWKKGGDPLLKIELLGFTHTLEDAGNMLFSKYLSAILQEDLYDHVWRFAKIENEYLAFDPSVPILASNMNIATPNYLRLGVDEDEKKGELVEALTEGSEFLFFYDEGSTTRLIATIEQIYTAPENTSLSSFPREVPELSEGVMNDRKRKIDEMNSTTEMKMDEKFPLLCRTLTKRSVRFHIGRGEPDSWSMVWGGGVNPSTHYSLVAPESFLDIDEAYLAFEKAMVMQVAPDHPTSDVYETYRCPNGDIVREKKIYSFKNGMPEFDIPAFVYPSTLNASRYQPEEEDQNVFGFRSSLIKVQETKTDARVLIKTTTRDHFNFSLPQNWKEENPTNDFSFVRKFPKCSRWICNPSKIAHRLVLDGGRLKAVKGKCTPQKPENVIFKTSLQHENLHDLFCELELLINK